MEVTLSAIIMAFIWLEVGCTAMMGVLLAVVNESASKN